MIKDYLKYSFIGDFIRQTRENKSIREWKKKYDNDSIPVMMFNHNLVNMGQWSYGELNVVSFNNISRLHIGNFVSIAQKVTFLLDVEHSIKTMSSYPFRTKVLGLGDEAFSKGDIIIDDDVWIGYGATILSGVHIGQGAVIAAGALVSNDVAPYSIVGGIPAKIIKKRFSETTIEYLMKLDYSKLDEEMIRSHIDDLCKEISDMNIKSIEQLYEWFPKKI